MTKNSVRERQTLLSKKIHSKECLTGWTDTDLIEIDRKNSQENSGIRREKTQRGALLHAWSI